MNLPSSESGGALRSAVYCLLIVTATAGMVGRVCRVKSELGKTPLLCANDRSRWCTVRALVDQGTYSIDNVLYDKSGKRNREWYSIDLVRHRGRDGQEHYYSSKPPLFPTLLAGKYWLLKTLTGVTLEARPFYAIRLLLITTNVLPLVLYFLLLVGLVERLGQTSWGRIFVVGAATWGTFLTTFAVTVNNHLPAAICVLIAVYASAPVFRDGEKRLRYFAVAGLAAAFAAANELPALSFLGLLGVGLFYRSPRETLIAFVPGALVVAAAFFLTTYIAHDSWRPPYAHRSDGPVAATLPASLVDSFTETPLTEDARNSFATAGVTLSEDTTVTPSYRQGRWILWDPQNQQRFALVLDDGNLLVREWDNWYEYDTSYWTPEKKAGVDRGEKSRGVYAFHVLVGHHGVFSLTPVWLLSVLGVGLWMRRGETSLRAFAVFVLLLTVICLAFYVMRPLADRNYGGVASGFRWMFWFTPLWLICLLPAADVASQNRWSRGVAWIFLFVSVVSASYAGLKPWSHPWIFDYWTYMKWIQY